MIIAVFKIREIKIFKGKSQAIENGNKIAQASNFSLNNITTEDKEHLGLLSGDINFIEIII